MDRPDDGGPAFPASVDRLAPQGMTLRDWFAGQALTHIALSGMAPSTTADVAYRIADEMLLRRQR